MADIKQFEYLKIPMEAIKSATNDFAEGNLIGKGGFGKVYKGEIVHSNTKIVVALKRLDRAFGQGDTEFWKEIMMLSFYKHENIVSLLGYCDDFREKILVYRYVSKESLDRYLASDDLTWLRRLTICIGAARGLAYLHAPVGSQLRLLHRDIKSSNILLDENWNAKISDFGLSKFGPANQRFTFIVSSATGTLGYCDPVYIESGVLTKESDVYSFGVVLFEVLCGRLSIYGNNDKRRPLIGLVREYYEKNRISELVYGKIKDEINRDSLKVFTEIAYRCLKRERKQCPLMTRIVKALEIALKYQTRVKVEPEELAEHAYREGEEEWEQGEQPPEPEPEPDPMSGQQEQDDHAYMEGEEEGEQPPEPEEPTPDQQESEDHVYYWEGGEEEGEQPPEPEPEEPASGQHDLEENVYEEWEEEGEPTPESEPRKPKSREIGYIVGLIFTIL